MKFDYRDFPTAIAGESSGPRQALEGHLKSLGFQNIAQVESVEALANRLAKSEVALLIGSATMGDGQVLELIRQIRRNEIAGQPFMPVVALVDEPEAMLVRRVIDSGADLIFTRPLSRTSVEQGLKALVMRRKPFVVTYDYVGPDRRRETRDDGNEIRLVEVSKPLRRWATGFSDEPPSKRILNTINTMRAQRQAVQFLWLADLVVAHFSGGPLDPELKDHLARMQTVANATKELAAATKYRNQVSVCDLAATAARAIEDAVTAGCEPNVTDLGHLTGQIQAAFGIQDASDATANV